MSFDFDKVESLYPGAGGLMIAPMLVWKLPAGKEDRLSSVCESGEYFAQTKIDGALYEFVKGSHGEKYLFGRTKSKVTGLLTEKGQNVPHILTALDSLPNGTVLIGEIYYDGCTAKDVVSIMGCLAEEAVKRQQVRGLIHYYVHDIIACEGVNLMDTDAWTRYRILKRVWELNDLDRFNFLRLAEVYEDNIEEELARILASGGEGIVLKKRTAPYTEDKRPAWDTIKVKTMDDIDLVCTRTIPATREYTGLEPETWSFWQDMSDNSVYCANHYGEEGYEPVTKPYYCGWRTSIGIGAYNNNGELVELGTVSSGLTDDEKAEMGRFPEDFVGTVVSLHCMSIDSKEYTLRHPVFKSWRRDKNPQDCKIDEIFG